MSDWELFKHYLRSTSVKIMDKIILMILVLAGFGLLIGCFGFFKVIGCTVIILMMRDNVK